MAIKERVITELKKKGIKAFQAEEDLHLARGYISKLDKSNPGADKLILLADYLGVTVDYLLDRHTPAYSPHIADFASRLIKLPPDYQRAVYVSDDIIKALGSGEGFIVNTPNPNALTQSFTHLRDRLGINVSLHSLRRFYASICHVLGVPDKYIMMQGGWKSRQTMEKSYQQIMDDKMIEYTARFENHFSTLMQHESNTERTQTRINTK